MFVFLFFPISLISIICCVIPISNLAVQISFLSCDLDNNYSWILLILNDGHCMNLAF